MSFFVFFSLSIHSAISNPLMLFLLSISTVCQLQADQICYSVLCVFSYVAAGQEQKKNFSVPKALPQQQQQTQMATTQSQSHQNRPVALTTSATSTKQSPSSQSQPKTQSQSVIIPTQKPTVTMAAVQPQTNVPKTSTAHQSAPSMQSRPSITEETKTSLPQLPPRVQSQASVPSRGPPPAIPPRNNLGARSSSIQVTSAGPINRPALTRQTSANMIPPQFTPQPPPKFVIPQRQSSRTSMGRSGSISGPSDGGSPSSTSPQSQRRQH